jgi:uncharacterized protein DUF2628
MSDLSTEGDAGDQRLRAAIGPRADYYLRHWRAMDEKGKGYDWNWAACFLNAYWMVFRKMWLALVLFILANIAVSLIGMAIPRLDKYTFVLMILLTFVTGSYGNRFYRRQTERLVASGLPAERLAMRGGTSPLALGIALVLTIALGVLAAKPVLQQIQAQRAARLHSP